MYNTVKEVIAAINSPTIYYGELEPSENRTVKIKLPDGSLLPITDVYIEKENGSELIISTKPVL